jgi:hypothetical protein
MGRRHALAALLVVGCSQNILPDPESRAASVPVEADVAVGASHDLLVIACQDKVTLTDLVLPVAATALFVGFGRLDAIFYLPEAELKAAIPQCEKVDYEVRDAAVDGPGLELETTANSKAFKLHVQGSGRFTAHALVDGEQLEVATEIRGHVPNRVLFEPTCDPLRAGETRHEGWLPAGASVQFAQRLYRDQLALSGYGLNATDDPRLGLRELSRGLASVQLPADPGDLALSSPFDPAFALSLHLYTAADIDTLELKRATAEDLFVGQTTTLSLRSTVNGKAPCVWGFNRLVTFETPAVCGLDDRTDLTSMSLQRPQDLRIEARATGRCRVKIEQPGTTLSATVELPVFEGFQPIALPDAAIHPAMALTDMWLASADELIIVGWKDDVAGALRAQVLRRNAGRWDPMREIFSLKVLRAVHGSRTDGAIFAVGNNGKGIRREGSTWPVLDTGVDKTLHDVWVFAANDVYAAGEGGTLLHFDGSAWTAINTGVTANLVSLWGAAPSDLWMVGPGPTVLRYRNGAIENALPAGVPATFNAPNAIGGTSLDNVWIVDNDTVMRTGPGAVWSSYDFGKQSGDLVSRIWPMSDGSAYTVLNRNSRISALWMGPTRAVLLPIAGGASITGFGSDVHVIGNDVLARYAHGSNVFP